jgi:hypothetical protein
VLRSKKEKGLLLEADNHLQVLMTEGSVRISQNDESVGVMVKSGSVRVGRAGRFTRWEKGRHEVFSDNEQEKMSAPETPLVQLPKAIFSKYDQAKKMRVQVRPALNATHYWLMVQGESGELEQLSRFADIKKVPLIDVKKAGVFRISVWAENAYGLLSAQSVPLELRVIGFGFGLLAVRDQVVYFRHGQRLQVLGDEGLLMRFGESRTSARAYGSLRIQGKGLRSIEFWSKEQPKDRVRFEVKSLEVSGKISFTPSEIAWPGPDLVVWISLKNIGLPPAQWQKLLTIRAQLGIEEITIDWQPRGDFLRGVIPAGDGVGPWVIRVSVEDASGRSIARNFHEVSPVKRIRMRSATASAH